MTDLISTSMGPNAPSIRTLSRPIKADRSPPSSEPYRKVLDALVFAIEHGDPETRAAAEVLVHRLICDAMAARLLEPERGPIRRLDDQLRKSVMSFREILR